VQPLWSSNSLVIMMKLNATAQPWDVDMDDALERRYAEIAPMIENIVRRTFQNPFGFLEESWRVSRSATLQKCKAKRLDLFVLTLTNCVFGYV
jgi:hypothetical protein